MTGKTYNENTWMCHHCFMHMSNKRGMQKKPARNNTQLVVLCHTCIVYTPQSKVQNKRHMKLHILYTVLERGL